MKKTNYIHRFSSLLLLLGLGFLTNYSHAQTYANSWINFNNTYYKFKIGKNGVYRITQSQLAAIGMGSVAGSQFTLFREGQELPVYVSTNGTLSSSDYIEFTATKADGKMDTPLYPNANFQPNVDNSIFTDSAVYFLTYDATTHPRITLINNTIPALPPAAAAYCWATAYPNESSRNAFNRGVSYGGSQSYYVSSDFDLGEGYAYGTGSYVNLTINTPEVYSSGPVSSVWVSWAGARAAGGSYPKFALNGNNIFDTAVLNSYRLVKRTLNVNSVNLSSINNLTFTDSVSFYAMGGSIKYPRTYNFSGNFTNEASFQIPASDRYLEISGFTAGTQGVKLYDKTNNKVYAGTVSGSLVKFYLDAATAARDVVLVNENSINTAITFTSVAFRNYSLSANQGDYVILSHKDYINASPSNVNEFKNYRNSIAGGSFQSVVVDVTELYNQFSYGYEYNPLSVKNFVYYANAQWAVKPKYMFIIGKGIDYTSAFTLEQNPAQYGFPAIPTWGEPGSDNLFSAFSNLGINSQVPILATGRLSVRSNAEIGNYLKKVKDYEEAIQPLAVPTVAHEFWKKAYLHIAGSTDVDLQTQLLSTLNSCATIIQDTLVGGHVTTIKKSGTDPVENVNNPAIDSLINKGLIGMSFYGHGSTAGFDYNLNDPDAYNSNPRFPIFGAYACEVAHIFSTSNTLTISEKYINSINGGSIVMMAGDNTGWTSTLPTYMNNLYRSFGYRSYGKRYGMQYRDNIEVLQSVDLSTFMDIHTQCQLYQGDPGLATYNPDKPDYVIETPGLTSVPSNVTTALDSFDLRVVVYNLGKTTKDSVWVRLQHTLSGSSTIMFVDSVHLANFLSTDTITFKVPLNATTDVGLNNYTVKIDANDQYDELSEENNQAVFQLYIYSESLIPVYPYEFSVMHQQDITLKASTLNAFAPLRSYRLEIDTTENFNSTLKQTTQISSTGGIIKWKPNIVYKDSVVYYWRTAPDSMVNGNYDWNSSSFIYLANGSDGWNQSHYYQYIKDLPFSFLSLEESTRKFKYSYNVNHLQIGNTIIDENIAANYDDMRQVLNDVPLDKWGSEFTGAVQFMVIDSVTGLPWPNTYTYGSPGLYGSSVQLYQNKTFRYIFEYRTADSVHRNLARLFLESIPNGNYVMIKNLIHDGPPGVLWDQQTADKWIADTLVYGSGKSLFHAMKNVGFTDIDQFTSKRVFGFFCKKGDNTFPVSQYFTTSHTEVMNLEVTFKSYSDSGSVVSKIIGPAQEWKKVLWQTSALDNYPQNDTSIMEVYARKINEQDSLIYQGSAHDIDISTLSATTYPYLKLKWIGIDKVTVSSPQLDYWRVQYSPVPEAALNAAALYSHVDTLGEGQKGALKIAIENLTPYPMDSMLVTYKLIDANGVKHNLDSVRYRPLPGNDTLIANLDYDISSYHGKDLILVEANPDNDQPEQYHPNNLGYIDQYVIADQQNPLLDVTFDGVHILDKDIVSAKPFIKVLMNDENKYLALNDTASLRVQLVYPDQTTGVDIPMDGTVCKFIPATIVDGRKNEARIEYKPTLAEDGVYQLIVSGKDRVGNIAGNAATYKINFTVDNTPSIANVLNYPNPFSTQTQFIFTMTGSEVPSQFKIQILSVTGKVVREIKKNELGNIHIGRNMTDYRWDGKDEFGQMLGNGVYLYRVVTSIRGTEVEHRANASVDKYFKNGYGKLYIMR